MSWNDLVIEKSRGIVTEKNIDDFNMDFWSAINNEHNSDIWSPVNKIDNLNRDFFVLCHD